jgi:rod shape determining protein RodA
MSAVFEQPSPWVHVRRVFAGFDAMLFIALLLLASLGLVAMYSAGYDHGTRFVDHGRNMLLALAVLFVVSQVSPRSCSSWPCRCT